MIKSLAYKFCIVILYCITAAQHDIRFEELLTKGVSYYNKGDYMNAIIIYEDLLAEQEFAYENNEIQIAETLTRLAEMYSIIEMPDISKYYFQQAISIFEKSFQKQKEDLEIPLQLWKTIRRA